MTRLNQLIVTFSLVLLAAGAVAGRDYFVDQKHPQADDKPNGSPSGNPGTEDKPFKTIQPAVDAARTSDIIYVKAGLYPDIVTFKGFGRPVHPITLTAWKDDRVVIGSELRELPSADQWKPVAGHKSYQVQMPQGTPEDIIVILEGKPILTERKDAPPPDDKYNWATYRKSDRTLMVNTGDGNPAAMHKLQFARRIEPFRVLDEAGYWKIQKLEFAWCNTGISMNGTGVLLEDCYFHNVYRPAIMSTGRMGTIRRCNFYKCGYGVGQEQGPASIIEDCLFVQCGQDAYEDIDSRMSDAPEPGNPILIKWGPVIGGIVRYNILADNNGSLWYDSAGTGLRIIGNAFWSNSYGNGINNEYGINDTFIIGNYFYRTGMFSSWSTRLTVVDNYFDNEFGGGIAWNNRDPWPLRYGFMTVRGNAFTGVHLGYLGGSDRGGDGVWPEGFLSAFVDYNQVRIRPDDSLLYWGKNTQVWKTEDLHKKYGWELHGEIKTWDRNNNDLTPQKMGATTVTFRVPWGPRSHLSRPMLADGGIDGRWPGVPEYSGGRFPAFFWRVADGNCDEKPLNLMFPDMTSDRLWRPNSAAGYDVGLNCGASWYVGAEDKYRDPKMKLEKEAFRAELSNGERWLVMVGAKPEEMPAAGVGWWTSWMSTAPGAKITVSFKMLGKKIESTEKAMPVVYMQFISATGQQVKRAYLVGRGEAQLGDAKLLHNRELTSGSFGWTEVKETVTAPDTAVRMSLFLGILPCKGELGFDDIDIKTADGTKPAGEAEIVEALPPARIAKERMREIIYVDLSKVANRSLTSPTAGDGKGWTDQGPDLDMRKLPTGEQSYGSVPFRLLNGPKAVVVLKGNGKAGADLPKDVTIPVGRKVEAFFILHAAAFMEARPAHPAEISVKYKDGTTALWQAEPNMPADWLAEPVRAFFGDAGTTAALTVRVGKQAKGTIYRTEWVLDRAKHDVPVESITFHGSGNGVPIILGVTGVTQW